MKKLFTGFLVILILLVGCESSNEPKDNEAPVVEKKTEFVIGETAEVDGLKITINGTRILEGDDFLEPDEGTQWIAIDFTFENTTDESVYIAGIFDITLKDEDGREKEMNIWGDLSGSVDGDVLPQEKLSGEKSFVITGEEANLYIYYKPTFSSDTPIKFVVK